MELNNHVVSADGLAGKHAIEREQITYQFLRIWFLIFNYYKLQKVIKPEGLYNE